MGFTRFVACRPHLHLAVLATLPGEAGWPGANARVWMLERSIAASRGASATAAAFRVTASQRLNEIRAWRITTTKTRDEATRPRDEVPFAHSMSVAHFDRGEKRLRRRC
jgi:hypothetical protein